MPSYARKEIVREGEVGIYHCVARCVRRAFLCGLDPVSGKNFEHRRAWIQQRLELLAANFACDVCAFSAMQNHLHVVLRTRPDLAEALSDEEVALRWWRIFPKRRNEDGTPADPEPHELRILVADPRAAAERRKRLASISWFMRCLCEKIARRANKEDQCTGRFWEGRFKCQALLDESAVLACSVYVDLNPIRAGICSTPEQSRFTSAYQRIHARQARRRRGKADAARRGRRGRTARGKRFDARGDAWLCPISADAAPPGVKGKGGERLKPPPVHTPPCRASWHGFLSMKLDDYLRLLDWTGRQVRGDKRGAIPKDLAPILDRLAIDDRMWVASVRNFGRWFHRAAGRAEHLMEAATSAGKHWFQGIAHGRAAFG